MKIFQKLHAWELNHLRHLSTEQQARIERLEVELEIVRQHADFWQDQAMHDDGPVRGVGMCLSGELIELEPRR